MSDARKRAAARAALREVRSGMLLGLGTGSTAHVFLLELAQALRDGALRDIRGVATSRATERTSRELAIPLADLPAGGVDLAIDGMDEVDPDLDAIKGLGGALLREKVVAESAARFVLIGDDGKAVRRLGERAPVPVEVLAFGVQRTAARIASLGLDPRVRGGPTEPLLTDNGNPVLDAAVPEGHDPYELARELDAIPGVMGHGLFLGLASVTYLADENGVERRERSS